MVEKYDVIVVGGGPAGLECARALIGSSLSVLVLEKKERIGPKTCAGGIVETVEPIRLPTADVRCFPSLNIRVGQKRFRFTNRVSVKVIDREALGRYQAQRLPLGRARRPSGCR